MSRSLFIPLMALAGIILYGTTQAARPELAPPSAPVYDELTPRPTASEASIHRPPPPAPRLQSEVEAEERTAAEAAAAPSRDTTEADVPTDGRPEI
ncbi:hypothetical protein [Rubrivirga sp. IMCC43871]|uniref:hypothetical protein n=1 Tax=Rubrivirga sp. IMCC43871 TaxID=3391575 RepID=UPI00398FA0E7